MKKEILVRFFKGECSEHEVKEVMDWLHSEKADEFFSDELLDLWAEYDKNKPEQPLINDLIVQKVTESLFEENRTKPLKIPINKPSKSKIWLLRIAAAFLIALTTLAVYFISRENTPSAVEEKISVVLKENPKGQKSRIYLPDGSVVWLNSDSRIKYPEKFTDTVRTVDLEGEAYFEVVNNPVKPFVVKAGQTSTMVLGTSFNINAYPENEGVTISLVEGKVSFKLQNNSFEDSKILNPGEGVHASYSKSSLNSFKFDPQEHLGWKDGRLVFKKADLWTVVSALERWYGVNIEVKDQSNKSWSFSGTFDNENLSNVLMNLSKMRDFTYEINGKDVTIKFIQPM